MNGASAECRPRLTGVSALNEEEKRALQAKAWHQRGAIVVVVDELPDDLDRQMFENFGNKKFGQRKG